MSLNADSAASGERYCWPVTIYRLLIWGGESLAGLKCTVEPDPLHIVE